LDIGHICIVLVLFFPQSERLHGVADSSALKKILNTDHSSMGSLHHEPLNVGVTNGFAKKTSCIGNSYQHSPQCDLVSVSAAKAVNQMIPCTLGSCMIFLHDIFSNDNVS
jgi:hypothetical protein